MAMRRQMLLELTTGVDFTEAWFEGERGREGAFRSMMRSRSRLFKVEISQLCNTSQLKIDHPQSPFPFRYTNQAKNYISSPFPPLQ
eukprot:scaffold1012_cov189-Alexandrium_tamarense.AAC.5